MAQTRANKPYYTFSAGINTDASLINFPENFSTDEENFVLQEDGSRARRAGLAFIPTSGDIEDDVLYVKYKKSHGTNESHVDSRVSICKWEAYDSTTGLSKNLLVVQDGAYLLIYDADTANPQENSYHYGNPIDLLQFAVSALGGVTPADIGRVSMSTGWGRLFVCEKHIDPIVLSWDSVDEEVTVRKIDLLERDFVGIEDGVGNTVQPATLTDTHEYNLVNRGWKLADITAYEAAENQYPSKNMVPALGYRRETTSNVAESDWTKAFSPAKLVSELFQNASAPQGHHIRSPFETGSAIVKDESTAYRITNWTTSTTTTGATATITVTTDKAHGLIANDKVWIEGQLSKYRKTNVPRHVPITTTFLDGEHTVVSAPSGTEFTFTITWRTFFAWVDQYVSKGTAYTATTVATGATVVTNYRPAVVCWYAGRVWYAGVPTANLESKLFFSPTIETENQFGLCYQRADPTDERINMLVATDGGVITIPELRKVRGILSHQGRLLVFGDNGVWEVSGGGRGYFTADDYSVRKVTEVGCAGSNSVVIAEDTPMYLGHDGIYAITYNPYTERLEASSASANKIDNLLKAITSEAKSLSVAAYDRRNKRVIWLMQSPAIRSVNPTSEVLDFCIVYDLRFQAFTKWSFYEDPSFSVASANVFWVHALENTSLEDPLVFWCRSYRAYFDFTYDTHVAAFARMSNRTDFGDFGWSAEPAYLVTGYDTLQDASTRKYPIYVTCYLKKTETGYTESGNDLLPVNEGSLKLQARWDWADNTSAGKWSPEREVYRHSRLYLPTDANDEFANGQPLVVTKNKVRGTGRAMHLKFTAGTGSDAKILGWQVLYAGTTEP